MQSSSLKINKAQLFGLAAILSLFANILAMFATQFWVDNLQEKINRANNEILEYEDQIRLLEVQWVYLTRPERLRELSNNYLENNHYLLANQIVEDLPENLPNSFNQEANFYTENSNSEPAMPAILGKNEAKTKQVINENQDNEFENKQKSLVEISQNLQKGSDSLKTIPASFSKNSQKSKTKIRNFSSL